MEERPKRRTQLEALRALAAGQDGQFASAQAWALGLGSGAVRWLHECGETVPVGRAISRFAAASGAPDPAVTALLACGPHAVISHASAARHHRLTRVPAPDVPEVPVPHHVTRRPAGVVVHRSRSLPGTDIVTVGGVRYTSLARTVCDLADPDDPWETLGRLDDAVAIGALDGCTSGPVRSGTAGRASPSCGGRRRPAPLRSSARGWSGRRRMSTAWRPCPTPSGTSRCTTPTGGSERSTRFGERGPW